MAGQLWVYVVPYTSTRVNAGWIDDLSLGKHGVSEIYRHISSLSALNSVYKLWITEMNASKTREKGLGNLSVLNNIRIPMLFSSRHLPLVSRTRKFYLLT
jgi:hypothetical protein